jgi:hypothetical protein
MGRFFETGIAGMTGLAQPIPLPFPRRPAELAQAVQIVNQEGRE